MREFGRGEVSEPGKFWILKGPYMGYLVVITIVITLVVMVIIRMIVIRMVIVIVVILITVRILHKYRRSSKDSGSCQHEG